MSQTFIQHPETIRFGSALLEIGDSLDSLVNVGACNGVKFTHELGDKVTIKSDNAGVVMERTGSQAAVVEADLLEINLDVLAEYLGGISKLSSSGDAQSYQNEVHTLVGTQFVRLHHRNSDGSEVSSIVVKKGGTSTTRGTDYVIAQDSQGYTCIARIAGSSVITDGSEITVSYTAMEGASKKLTLGGLRTLEAKMARLTNYDSQGRPFSITVYKATADSGIAIEFKADDADETDVVPIKLRGTEDVSRAAGDQLFVIEDFQL